MEAQSPTRILIVDDSKFFSRMVRKEIAARIGAEIVTVDTLAGVKKAVEAAEEPFHLALVDIILPDSSEGEAAEFLMQRKVPCVVFTSFFSEDLRKMILDWNVIDYVIKETPSSLDYLMDVVERVHRNRQTKVLIVDDSKSSRQHVRGLLAGYLCQVVEAASGEEALQKLEAEPDIRLVITDFYMPGMNGIELVQEIRKKFDREHLAIIGLATGVSRGALSAQFIKFGANDFINKPFLPEEFFCRLAQNLRMLDLVTKLRDMAIRDALTEIHNRRFFFEAGKGLFANAKRDQIRLTAAMIDLDHFKQINDTHGHEAGDLVLKRVAALLRSHCRQTDVVVRFGGEEFAVLAVNVADASVRQFFDKVRGMIEQEEILYKGKPLRVTASFGVCHGARASLDAMMKEADRLLYKAKEKGRNRVEIDGLRD
jgi:diguanylate cyclase (GGDEF)-like protein